MPLLEDNHKATIKIRIGKYLKPIQIRRDGNYYYLKWSFNRAIMREVKENFRGARWTNNAAKEWKIDVCSRNDFRLAFLIKGFEVYEHFEQPVQSFPAKRNVFPHQQRMKDFILTRHFAICAYEMGTGKTLACIEAMEDSGATDWLWVGPKSAITSVKLEFEKWNAKVHPRFVTYNKLYDVVMEWPTDVPAPQGIIFDESPRVKTPTSKRSQAAEHIAEQIRAEHGKKGYVVLMSGTPAPRSPVDWYNQCEVAFPGFIREGDIKKFQERLAFMEQSENPVTGGVFKRVLGWRDDENKCNNCGEYKESPIHLNNCKFEPSRDEVAKLFRRMDGLVIKALKKDCLGLPEKHYRVIECPPTKSTLRAAQMITKTSSSGIKALTRLRELSDGFQYVHEESEVKTEKCPACAGVGKYDDFVYIGPEKDWDLVRKIYDDPDHIRVLKNNNFDPETLHLSPSEFPDYYEKVRDVCTACEGTGQVKAIHRVTKTSHCPKDEALRDLLDEHKDIGRLVVYAGFTGSIDKIMEIVAKQGWDYIKVDGRGWKSTVGVRQTPEQMVKEFQSGSTPRICFIGHPKAAGTGLTLTASPSIVFYSNDFDAEARQQSEDRIHRAGMDENRGATIIDLIHLDSDTYVIENLRAKKKLQSKTLGEISELFKEE